MLGASGLAGCSKGDRAGKSREEGGISAREHHNYHQGALAFRRAAIEMRHAVQDQRELVDYEVRHGNNLLSRDKQANVWQDEIQQKTHRMRMILDAHLEALQSETVAGRVENYPDQLALKQPLAIEKNRDYWFASDTAGELRAKGLQDTLQRYEQWANRAMLQLQQREYPPGDPPQVIQPLVLKPGQLYPSLRDASIFPFANPANETWTSVNFRGQPPVASVFFLTQLKLRITNTELALLKQLEYELRPSSRKNRN
jgi:hypothetical protein